MKYKTIVVYCVLYQNVANNRHHSCKKTGPGRLFLLRDINCRGVSEREGTCIRVNTVLVSTCSPFPLCQSAHEVWKTCLHFKFAPLVTTMSPVFTLPIVLHSCCNFGPAAALKDLALAFLPRSRSDDVELTIESTYGTAQHVLLYYICYNLFLCYMLKFINN